MENGEYVIISGRAKPKTGLLVSAIFMIICLIVGIILIGTRNQNKGNTMTAVIASLVGLAGIVSLRFYFMSKKSNITVTNMRIMGATAWGSVVNLPLNQATSAAIEPTGALIVSTNSGNIIFAKMDNTPQIFTEINKLLMTR